ncbi:MAG TPA: choice-of-anchor Q domain-containing protein [Anaerolineae bacterium]|nr:choice-of-anchor Q domain-containing protein [Anaerolineae bacterium]
MPYIIVAAASVLSLLVLVGQSLPTVRAAVTAAGHTYVVNSTADLPDGNVTDNACQALNGHCTLRAAIMQANFTSGMDTILLPMGTYTLTIPGVDDTDQAGDLDISDDLAIVGDGPDQTIVDGNGAITGDRAFHILSTANQASLSGITIRNGDTVYTSTSQNAGFGGGIYQDGGDLNLTDVVIEDNHASYGGGLVPSFFNRAGTTALERVTIRSNHAEQYGGGVYLIDMNGSGTSRLAVSHSTINGNTAQRGGGISFQGFGFNGVYPTILALTNTTVSGNSVDHDGGGIYDLGGLVQLANVTVTNNRVNLPAADNGGLGGGGVATAAANGFVPTLDVKNSLIGNNTRRKEGVLFTFQDDCNGAITSFGNNLFQSTTNCTINVASGDLKNVDPLLGPLQNNGGSTQTQALLKGSPAIDAGNPNGCIDFNATAVNTDQRGFHRPIGPYCDIGAVEYSPYAIDLPIVYR